MKNEFQYRLLKSIGNANITAAELAEKTGISEASISNYINGKYVAKQDRCYAIAKALGVDPGWLMTGDEPRKEANKKADDPPKTEEARILAKGIDKLPQEQREQALSVIKAMFAKYSNYFEKENDDEP